MSVKDIDIIYATEYCAPNLNILNFFYVVAHVQSIFLSLIHSFLFPPAILIRKYVPVKTVNQMGICGFHEATEKAQMD